jgi:hypothetical protein
MVAETTTEDPKLTVNAADERIGPRVGIARHPPRLGKQAHIDAGLEAGTSPSDAKRIKDLVAEVRELVGFQKSA